MGTIGVLLGLATLILLALRGVNILIVSLIAAGVVAVTNQLPWAEALTVHYTGAMMGFAGAFFVLFLTGAVFGRVMAESGAAQSIGLALRQLIGDDAVFQLFQSPVEGEFSFTGRDIEEEEVQSEVTLPAISLLMESVRLQDELPMLEERLPDPDRVFHQKAQQLSWEDTDSVELAASVWARLKKGASIQELQREVPRCSYSIYRTLTTLLDDGQIE